MKKMGREEGHNNTNQLRASVKIETTMRIHQESTITRNPLK